MITETVTRIILHCSRCNTTFTDDYDGSETTILWTAEELTDAFPADQRWWDDAQGWIRLGDRALCGDCWDEPAGDELETATEKPPLSAADATKVARAQMAYKPLRDEADRPHRRPADMSLGDLVKVLDDIRGRVADGDSWEGSLEYLIPDDPGDGVDFTVRASYRIGNLQGQGGFRLIEGEAPDAT